MTNSSQSDGNEHTEHLKPSQVNDVYWLFAKRETGTYPQHTEFGGKWLIFVSIDQIDEVWEKIKNATISGVLGGQSKVATDKPNPNARDSKQKVICVYTYDWKDTNDVMRVRNSLREIGISWKIPYKADKETRSGVYANRKHTRISKYYE